jgi:hypothetical protein
VEIFPGNETFEGWQARAFIMTGNFKEALKITSQVEDNDRLWLLLYFKQNNIRKLDSLLAVRNFKALSNNDKIEYYLLKNEREKAVAMLRDNTISFSDISQLRSSPILRSIEQDNDYKKVINQFDFKEGTLDLNWK